MNVSQGNHPAAEILIADDRPENLQILLTIFEEQGYTVRPSLKGSMVFSSALNKPPDIILLDILMPDMDGYRVCAQLKADERTRDIPVIFISGLHEAIDRAKGFRLGGVGYITKPFYPEEILAQVEVHLNVRRMQRRLKEQNILLQQEIAEHKQAKQEILNSRQNLAQAQSIAHAGSWEWDYVTDNVFWSDETYRLFGWRPGEVDVTYATYRERVHPEDLERVEQDIRDALTGKKPYENEHRIIQLNGDVRVHHTQGKVSYDKQGNPLRMVGVVQDITERKQAEEALQKSEEAFRQFFDNVPEVVVLQNIADGSIVHISQAYEKVFGQSIETIIQTPDIFIETLHPDDRERLLRIFQEQIGPNASGRGFHTEYRVMHPDGSIRWIDSQGFPICDLAGIPYRLAVVARDITEHKQNEELLQLQRQIVENMAEGVHLIRQSDGIIVYANAALERMFGYDAGELPGCHVSILNAPTAKDPEETAREIIRSLHKKGSWSDYVYNIKKDGTPFWCHANVSSFTHSLYGAVWISVHEDISERKHAEEERDRFFEISLDMLCIAGTDGYFKRLNPAFEEILGFTKKELLSRPFTDFIHPDDLASTLSEVNKQLTGIPTMHFENRYRCQDGSYKWLSWKAVAFTEEGLLYASARDITRQKQVEKTLHESQKAALNAKNAAEKANQAKSDFLANMSHEIRTPMNAILGFSEILSSLVTDERQKSYLDAIQSSGKNLLALINDILDLSKIEAGKMELHYEPAPLARLLVELRSVFSLRLSQKKLDLTMDISDDIPQHLLLDEVRLRQVLFNLLGNAVKFTEQGFVKLSADVRRRRSSSPGLPTPNILDLTITIQDTGIGIPAEAQGKIFDAFTQHDPRSTKAYGGTGLGLAISKRLVEMMNGSISLNSTPGRGSLFTIVLRDVRIVEAVPRTKEEDRFDDTRITFEPATILVADDVESNRSLITAYFQEMSGIRILEAENGEQALFLAEQHHPDVILMDIRMPVLNGNEAVKRLKRNERLKHIPVLALTAFAMKQERRSMLSDDFDDYLIKPIQRAELFHELTRFLHYFEQEYETSSAPQSRQKPENEDVADSCSPQKRTVLINCLRQEMMREWETVRRHGVFDEIEQFAVQLTELGKRYAVNELERFGDELSTAVHHFDVETIETILDSYPEFIQTTERNTQ